MQLCNKPFFLLGHARKCLWVQRLTKVAFAAVSALLREHADIDLAVLVIFRRSVGALDANGWMMCSLYFKPATPYVVTCVILIVHLLKVVACEMLIIHLLQTCGMKRSSEK